MQKDNVMRSSEFHMAEGDVLHLLFRDEYAAMPDVRLVSGGTTDNTQEAPDAPIAYEASDITYNSFTANWALIENASGYYLDVATDENFTLMVAGYNNLNVGYVNEYSVIGLGDLTNYFYRLRAYNENGTSSDSNIIILTTLIDLAEIVIGTQTWKLRNASANVSGSIVYGNNEANRMIYGALYTWNMIAAVEAIYEGYHVPTDAEWTTLSTFLGGEAIAGGALKEAGIIHWDAPNTGATNSSGFTALPGGYANSTPVYSFINQNGFFWTASSYSVTMAWRRRLDYNSQAIDRNYLQKGYYASIRLIKD
jgi:uncharacterized protein (TIGR02145 family)